MKTLLFHPSAAPFVQQVGRALYENEMLEAFATTIAAHPGGLWRRRVVSELPMSKVRCYPWREVVRVGAAKLFRNDVLTDRIWEWAETGFDEWVTASLTDRVDAVYGYEHASLATFEAAAGRRMKCWYDVPAPEHEFVQAILDREMEEHVRIPTPYQQRVKDLQAERTERRRREWQLADRIIANSEYTKSSYAAAGLDVGKVRVVPYGAPPVHDRAREGGGVASEPLRVLWAGTFSVRKGAHYLLQAWRGFGSAARSTLRVFGALDLPRELMREVPPAVSFSGTIPKENLVAEYLAADVLVFPTLCDGFGMVVTEALAHGLPVITTDRAGARDLIRDRENGFIIPARDARAIEEVLGWCERERSKLREMRSEAVQSAAKWQWSDYRSTVVERLKNER